MINKLFFTLFSYYYRFQFYFNCFFLPAFHTASTTSNFIQKFYLLCWDILIIYPRPRPVSYPSPHPGPLLDPRYNFLSRPIFSVLSIYTVLQIYTVLPVFTVFSEKWDDRGGDVDRCTEVYVLNIRVHSWEGCELRIMRNVQCVRTAC